MAKNNGSVKEKELFDPNFIDEVIKWGGDNIIRSFDEVEFAHSGSLYLDRAFGGGLPMGRMIHLAGKTGYGKSTIALIAAVALIKAGLRVMWVDFEKRFDPNYARRMGIIVDPNDKNFNMLKITPPFTEEAFRIIRKSVELNAIDYIVFDSLAASVTRAEFESDEEDRHMMVRARVWADFMYRMSGPLELKNIGMLITNQFRESLEYEKIYPGGRAKDHFMSMMIDLTKPDLIWRVVKGGKIEHVMKSTKPQGKIDGVYGMKINGMVVQSRVGFDKIPFEIQVAFRPTLAVDKGAEITKLGRELFLFTKENGDPILSSAAYHWYKGINLGKPSDVIQSLSQNNLTSQVVSEIRELIEQEKQNAINNS